HGVANLLHVEVRLGLAQERPAVGLRQGQRAEALAVNPGVALLAELAVLLLAEEEFHALEQGLAAVAVERLIGGGEVRQAGGAGGGGGGGVFPGGGGVL